jgi:hypothetical protein
MYIHLVAKSVATWLFQGILNIYLLILWGILGFLKFILVSYGLFKNILCLIFGKIKL